MGFIAALKEKGYDPDKLKKLFESTDIETDPAKSKVKALIERHTVLVRDGLDANYQDARFYAAIDRAYDVGQEQISATIMRGLIGKDPSSDEVLSMIKDWKLEYLLVDAFDGNGKPLYTNVGGVQVQRKLLDLPIFFNVLVPVVAAYTNVRRAKLWTDRNTVPLYKYDPASSSIDNHTLCRVITAEIAKHAENMGYRAKERDVILPTLLYGFSWMFPRSSYQIDKGLWKDDDKKAEEYVIREGINWEIVHPTKTFWDRSAPMISINTDTGVGWMGYWSIVPFRSIDTDKYWNKGKIQASSRGGNSTWVRPDGWRIYTQYYPCVLKFPLAWTTNVDNQREDRWYSSAMGESAVQVVNFFDKIVPKDWGLFDCDIPVWFRFMYAGDGTVIGCEPFPYTPGNVNVDAHDSNRARNTSLALDLVPHQDLIGNLLTQYVLSVQQNLMNLTFYNQEQIPTETIDQIRNRGSKKYVGANFAPFSKRQNQLQGAPIQDSFYSVNFPKQQVTEQIGAINTHLSIMERMLGFSPQEVGAAASHQQSATEVTIVEGGTSTRLALTGSYMDDGRQSRQEASYIAWLEYGTKEIDTELSGITPSIEKILKKLGFTVERLPDSRTIKVTGKRRLADIDGFVQARAPGDRFQDAKVAIAMLQAIQLIMSNPEAVQRYGIDFILKRFNEILEYAGVPGDWRFDLDQAKDPQPNLEQTQELISANNEVVGKQIQESVIQPVGDSLQKIQEGQQQLGQGLQQALQDQQQIAGAVGEHSDVIKQLVAQMQAIVMQLGQPPPTAMIPPPPQQIDPAMAIALLEQNQPVPVPQPI